MARTRFTLGIALDGEGWHPGVTRTPQGAAFSARAWAGLATDFETAGVDYLTLEDTFSGWSPFWRTEPAGNAGRLDALTLAAYLAGATKRIGIIPTATVTLTEPYHVATRLQTLDFTSDGRASWQVRVSADGGDFRYTALAAGKQPAIVDGVINEAALTEPFAEADAVVATARELWDSWEDGAEIRDAATGRFLDGDRVHHVNAETKWFSVAGPSIVPRSPSGQLLVTALAHSTVPYQLAVDGADVVFVTPLTENPLPEIVAEIRELESAAARTEPLRIVADLLVAVGADAGKRVAALDAVAPLASDAQLVAGTAAHIADEIQRLWESGADGVRLRPVEHAVDGPAIIAELIPELTVRGIFEPRASVDGGLRAAFSLGRPESRHVLSHEPADETNVTNETTDDEELVGAR